MKLDFFSRVLTILFTAIAMQLTACGGGNESVVVTSNAANTPPSESATPAKSFPEFPTTRSLKSSYQSEKITVPTDEVAAVISATRMSTWAYFRDQDQKRWYISPIDAANGDVFSLGQSENGREAWWRVGENAGTTNQDLQRIKINAGLQTNLSTNFFSAIIAGNWTWKYDAQIANDRTAIQGDDIPIEWYFFPGPTGRWYIVYNQGTSNREPVVLRFALDSTGQYDWEPFDTAGLGVKFTPKPNLGMLVKLYTKFIWPTALPQNTTIDSPASQIYSEGFGFLQDTGTTYSACANTNQRVTQHPGLDINIIGTAGDRDAGTPVLAPARGVVVAVNNSATVGGLTIRHDLENGTSVWSAFRHLQPNITVAPGTIVERGTEIARLGDSGTQNAHLHYELRTASHPDPSNANYWCGYSNQTEATLRTWLHEPLSFMRSRK